MLQWTLVLLYMKQIDPLQYKIFFWIAKFLGKVVPLKSYSTTTGWGIAEGEATGWNLGI